MLADNVRRKVAGQTLYFRNYPQRGLAAHIVGYSTQVRSRAGLESSENDFLTGSNTNLSTVLDTTLDKLKGTTVEGNDLTSRCGPARATGRPRTRSVASAAPPWRSSRARAVVLVSVSSPTYDPNLIESHYNLAARPKFGCPPLLNRAEGTPGTPPSGVYIPGSAFKVVTAAAALDSGRFTLDSTFHDPGYCIEYGKPVYELRRPERTRSCSARVNFTQALAALDQRRFLRDREGARRPEDPRLREALRLLLGAAARDARRTSGRPAGSTTTAGSSSRRTTSRSTRAASRSARSGSQVTPIQMAMVTATIANGGLLMRPYVVERVVAPDGSTVTKTKPDTARARDQREHGERPHRDDGGGRPPAAPGPPPRSRASASPARPEPPRRARVTSTRRGSSASRPRTTRRSQSPSSSRSRARPAARPRRRSRSRSWKHFSGERRIP